MPSRTTVDFICNECGTEYMVIYEDDYVVEQPMYCPFCSEKTDDFNDLNVDE